MNISYLQLYSGMKPPSVEGFKPFLAIMVIEQKVEPTWRETISRWLVKSGCIYMLAWGDECKAWEDAVDLANLEQFNFGEIPEDELVITTQHEEESLKDVFEFAKNSAEHACVDFANTLILHISKENREQELLAIYSGV